MDHNHPHRHPKTVPIRGRHGESSSSASSSDVEDFINTRFHEDEDEDIIHVVDLQHEDKPPLFTLFPDLNEKDRAHLARTTSTTQVTQILVGKKPDFSLLKPSKKLNPEQSRLPPLVETSEEQNPHDEEMGN